MQRGHKPKALTLCAATALAGCSSATLPTLPLPTSAAYSQPPAEIYTRIAGGALGCWFGPTGPLKRTHIFHADVAPPSDNAGAEIVIHERDNTPGQSPRAIRAYRIIITRAPEGTFLAAENLKLPAPLAARMEADIQRWAKGQRGCNTEGPEDWPAQETKASAPATSALPPAKGKAR